MIEEKVSIFNKMVKIFKDNIKNTKNEFRLPLHMEEYVVF
jgi:hypothetical protein